MSSPRSAYLYNRIPKRQCAKCHVERVLDDFRGQNKTCSMCLGWLFENRRRKKDDRDAGVILEGGSKAYCASCNYARPIVLFERLGRLPCLTCAPCREMAKAKYDARRNARRVAMEDLPADPQQ